MGNPATPTLYANRLAAPDGLLGIVLDSPFIFGEDEGAVSSEEGVALASQITAVGNRVTALEDVVHQCALVEIESGAESVVIVFPTPFVAAPTGLHAQVLMPSGGVIIACAPDYSTLTTVGCTVRLGAATPDGTYKLYYFAE